MRHTAFRRRRPASRPATVRPNPPEPQPCRGCSNLFRFYDGAEHVCDNCHCLEMGHTPRGLMPDGTVPRLSMQQHGVQQRCTGPCGFAQCLADLDAQGRCHFCRRPGTIVRDGIDGHIIGLVHDGTFRPQRYSADTSFEVKLTADGLVPIVRVSQGDYGRPERGRPDTVRVTDTPRWAEGWLVTTAEGEQRWWRANWDSSD